jgi:hypothetical protein
MKCGIGIFLVLLSWFGGLRAVELPSFELSTEGFTVIVGESQEIQLWLL